MSKRLRIYRILFTIFRIYLRQWSLKFYKPFLSRERLKDRIKRVNIKNADLLYRTIIRLQGLFIKVGQFMSLRVDLLPTAYTRTLSRLQDQVPPAPYKLILERLTEEYGNPPDEVFKAFNPKPIAAASLGQVHDATLKDGRRVAVKVQYPSIEEILETDLKILGLILWWFSKFRRQFEGNVILKEFKKLVTSELDYINEGRNAERVAKNFPGDGKVIIPEVIWEYTTKKVLTLEFIDGIKITDTDRLKEAGFDMKEVSRLVMNCYFKQLFKDGFFQADAHPGNLFILPGPKLGLLDFGLSKELPTGFLSNFGRLALSVIKRDPKDMACAIKDIGFVTSGNSDEVFLEFSNFVIGHTKEFIYRDPKKIDYQGIFSQITALVRDNPIVRIPEDFILIGRVLGQLSGLGRKLKAPIKVDELVLPYLSGINFSPKDDHL